MTHDTLFDKTLQFASAAVRGRRKCLEQATLDNWNKENSRTIDACLHVEEALASLAALERASNLSRPSPVPAAQIFILPGTVTRAWTAERLHVRTHPGAGRQEATGFESVGSILPRVMQGIQAAAGSNRKRGRR
jgi:hypothetical protein